ncbi:phosphohistidine phosphatase SixA [Azotobacter chroococcum]|jgi:phosphohistidine phosphatase|uniref:phosphohistidine phosphatase SixA n=1 Tax=Azotobacter chroococcum TaxID=353 RepID=UPI00103E9D6E|nr:phosphohistidine phosphatase SixA [Azotobacter chroococcum]TBW09039.1 phosphohistidine phosphatase SixA [Azotobacter chroococcum]TKD34962.1 phosphohistidine phosphatase SixA [Azotobacter chroococcum]
MKLWLLRHGEAEPHARTDAERELTRHGRKEVRQAAAHLAHRPLRTILCSPYVRARQTAELLEALLDSAPQLAVADWLTPDDDPRQALDRLAERSEEELLLVSHQPFIGALAGLLIHGHLQDPLPMQTASLAELDGELPLAGAMYLRALNHPGHRH